MPQSSYVKSNFKRNAGDHYPTIDTRAVDAFLEHFPKADRIVDVCADQGSAIVDYLKILGKDVVGIGDAFCSDADFPESKIVLTNTPYERPLVDKIISRQLARLVDHKIEIAAFLLRSTFDHAAKRSKTLFNHEYYLCQIKINARLWWTDNREVSPIHNFSWFIFATARIRPCSLPIVLYYTPPYDKRYAADNLHFKCRECGWGGKKGGRIKRTSLAYVEKCPHCNDPAYLL